MFKNEKFVSFLIVLTSVSSIISSLSILQHSSSILVKILNYSMLFTMLFLDFFLLFKKDVWLVAKIRLFTDHFFVSAAVFLSEFYPQIFYFYVIMLLIHSFCNIYMFDVNRNISKFLKIIPVFVSMFSVFILIDNLMVMYLFLFAIFCSLLIVSGIESTTLKLIEMEKNNSVVKQIQKSLVVHNINNQACQLMFQLSKKSPDLTNVTKSIFDHIKESINNMVEPKKSDIKIFQLVNRMASYFMTNMKDININVNIPNIMYNLYEDLFLSSLYVFFSNSCEAGAKNIKVYLDDSNLVIEDDGCGFDTSKMKWGYTTKKDGHGYGLLTTLDALKAGDIDVDVLSKVGSGTKIILKLNNPVVA